MIKWSPDSCLCEFIVDENFNYVNWIQKCQFHKMLNGNSLFTVVHNHNKNLNLTNRSKDERKQDKANEKSRIRNLGDPEINV